MQEKVGKKNLRKSRRRKLLWFFAILAFSTFLLHVGLYYSSDFLLRNFLQRQIEKLSDGKYHVDFERFNLSLLQRGVYVTGFSLSPTDERIFEDENRPYYDIHIPEFSLKGISYSFRNEILNIGTIGFKSPVIQSRQDKSTLESEKITPLELLEIEIQKSFGDKFRDIQIGDIFVEDADLLLENFISQKTIQASETNLHVKNSHLLNIESRTTPFNAEGFDFDLKNFEMLLSDSIHTIKATKVQISSLDQYIRVEKVGIHPDITKKSDIYYEIELENLELTDADINQMFYSSDVKIGELKLVNPKFSRFSEITAKDDRESSYDLYPLIQDVLASISIRDLTIVDGKYLQRSIKDANKNRLEAENIQFKMDQVYIGPDSTMALNQFFYAQDAELDISRVKIALADGIHWITGEKVFLSSFEDKITVTKVNLAPVLQEGEETDIPLFEIEVPSLSLGNANLKKIYNESILDIEEMIISSPSVLLRDLQGNQDVNTGSTLQDLTQDFLKAIYVNRLEMTDGNLVLDNHLRVRQDSLAFGKISFVLENFRLDENIETDLSSRVFLAEELQLEVEDYALKLSDNLHLFTAGKIFIDTKEDFIKIDAFKLSPQNPDNIRSTLERYGKTTALNIEVPEFFVMGVDLAEAFFYERLFVKHINIPSPIIKIQDYGKKEEDDINKVERGDILEIFNNYFSEVKVDSVSLEEGSFIYENLDEERIRTFSENDVNVAIKNFYLDESVEPVDSRLFYAEEVDISLNNYIFNIADGKYNLIADRISFNSAREEINTFNVRLRPSRNLDTKVIIQANIPDMSIKGVDLEGFLFENTLSLSNLRLSDANVQLSINRDSEEEDDSVGRSQRRRERNLPKTIDIIAVDTIEAANAKFNVSYREDGVNSDLINTGINLTFYDFLLDSAKLEQGDIASFFNSVAVEIDDFSLVLKDSVHTVNFSRVELNSRSDEILLDNFSVTPRNFKGKKGFPVIDARIPSVTLSTGSLTSFQSTGDFLVEQLILRQPDITIYLDSDEMMKLSEEEPEEEKTSQRLIDLLKIETFEISGGSLKIKEKLQTEDIGNFQNLSILLNDLEFDLNDAGSFDKKFFLNKDYQFELPDYEIKLPDSLNILKIGLVVLSKDMLKLQDVELIPRYGKFEYTRRVGFQTDVANVKIPEIVFHDLQVEKLVSEKVLEARSMQVYGPDIHVYRDKRAKFDSTVHREMPQKLMMQSLFNLMLDSLSIKDGKVEYEEFPEKGYVPGQIIFSDLDAVFTPFYLKKEEEEYGIESSHLTAKGLLNQKALLGLDAELFFQSPYPIRLDASVGEFELALLNPMLEKNAFARVRRGAVRGGEWSFVMDEKEAIGNMTLRYNDLNIVLLDERTLEVGRGRKGVLTFVINVLAVRSNNPRKFFNTLKSSTIYESRDKNRFVFNYLWKSTLSGLVGSVGLGQPKIPKREEDEED